MARIPEADIERLNNQIASEVSRGAGIELKQHGADRIGPCLDRRQTGGFRAINWVVKTRGISLRHAVELIAAAVYFIFVRASSRIRLARDGLNTPQEQNRAM